MYDRHIFSFLLNVIITDGRISIGNSPRDERRPIAYGTLKQLRLFL
jgi:hypothetical protein